MSDIVRLLAVQKAFSDTIAVDDVSLSVETGEFVTLLGPSGCGKSTLLRLIGGFEMPTAGRILLGSEDVTDLPPNRRPVNMVFQDYALFPHMNVGRNVGYGLRIAGTPKAEAAKRVMDALDLVGLAEKIEASPAELSGGQRQRVALARAIVRRPKVLLLDEPLSALDANLREQMQVELKHLHAKVGLTFIMVTHDQSEALAMADRVVLMRDGKIVQEGAPVTLYDKPASAYVANFIGTTNLFPSKVEDSDQGKQIACHGHVLQIGADLPVRAGETALFGFRPEKAILLPATGRRTANGTAPAGNNLLRGRVEEVLFQGVGARIAIDLGAGRILVNTPIDDAHEAASLPGAGDEIAIEVAPHKIMVFADDRA